MLYQWQLPIKEFSSNIQQLNNSRCHLSHQISFNIYYRLTKTKLNNFSRKIIKSREFVIKYSIFSTKQSQQNLSDLTQLDKNKLENIHLEATVGIKRFAKFWRLFYEGLIIIYINNDINEYMMRN